MIVAAFFVVICSLICYRRGAKPLATVGERIHFNRSLQARQPLTGALAMSPKIWIFIGIVISGLAVVSGAFGAHGLDKLLLKKLAANPEAASDPAFSVERLSHDYEVAVRYQMFHGLALVALGVLAAMWPTRWWDVAG